MAGSLDQVVQDREIHDVSAADNDYLKVIADARLKLEKINSLSEAGVRRARVQPPVAALARSVATKRGGGREQSDSVMALHPVFGQYWKALPRCRPRDMRCARITSECAEAHAPPPGALANATRHLALAEAVRILAGTRGYLA